MDRLACINARAFALQLLLRSHPEWRGSPAAVVQEDTPNGRLLWVNEVARRQSILPGMRYATALSLVPGLCAGVVPQPTIQDGLNQVAEVLRRFTPGVEICQDDPGIFWADASGLDWLYPKLVDWASTIHAELATQRFASNIVVGFSRFGTEALARSLTRRPVWVAESPVAEQAAVERVPIHRLRLPAPVRDTLMALGVTTTGAFLQLPPAGVQRRFGSEVATLYRQARGEVWSPIQPQPEITAASQSLALDHSEDNSQRLLFLCKRLLHPVLHCLYDQGEALGALQLDFQLDGGEPVSTEISPAEPTLSAKLLLRLVMLRLDRLAQDGAFATGVTDITVSATGVPAVAEQLQLFAKHPTRDIDAAKQAFAQLRAEFGDQVVVHAELREGHLPEAQFRWVPAGNLELAPPARVHTASLVRRIYRTPRPLPARPKHEEDGWQLRGRQDTAVDQLVGPYVVSGGWWQCEVHRDYYFARNQDGEWLWVYFDRHRNRWFLHGRVE